MVSSGGLQVVEAGGTASDTIVSSGGTLELISGGSDPGLVVDAGGTLELGPESRPPASPSAAA